MSEQAWVVMRQDTSDDRTLDLVHVDNIEERAHLIAAAPELLEACKAMMDYAPRIASVFGPKGDWDMLKQRCQAAIAKAEGSASCQPAQEANGIADGSS